MIPSSLFDTDDLPANERLATPDPETLQPEHIVRERTRSVFRSKLEREPIPTHIVLTHGDADGLTSAALRKVATSSPPSVIQTATYNSGFRLIDALETVQDALTAGTLGSDKSRVTIEICDFGPTDEAAVLDVLERILDYHKTSVRWFDHHQWDNGLKQKIRTLGVELYHDTEECTASLIGRVADLDDQDDLSELIRLTKDYDLWIREDPRSERLQTLSKVVDPDEYIDIVLDHGIDFPPAIAEQIDERRQRDQEIEALAVEQATIHPIKDETVALTYVSGGRSSTIGNDLIEVYDASIAAVLRPHGGVSIYAASDESGFTGCHRIARQLGGGGHPTAAGGSFSFDTFREFAMYLATAGQSQHDALTDAIKTVL